MRKRFGVQTPSTSKLTNNSYSNWNQKHVISTSSRDRYIISLLFLFLLICIFLYFLLMISIQWYKMNTRRQTLLFFGGVSNYKERLLLTLNYSTLLFFFLFVFHVILFILFCGILLIFIITKRTQIPIIKDNNYKL